jgi:antitoxin component YwqK of YwqJK toxin-antitoxin module
MLTLGSLIVNDMRIIVLTLLILSGINISAQNTRLVFDQYYVDKSDFDGDYISNYDLNKTKDNLNANEASETYVVYHENGQIAELGLIIDNKAEGVWKTWDENGNLLGRVKYKTGQKNGRFIIKNTKGQLIAKGHYGKNGNKIGKWLLWDSDAKRMIKRDFNS